MDKEVEEFIEEQEDIITEMKETKQPTVAGGITADTEKTKEVKPPMNTPNTSIDRKSVV